MTPGACKAILVLSMSIQEELELSWTETEDFCVVAVGFRLSLS